jgi:pyruvate formate lyase activating enzyme
VISGGEPTLQKDLPEFMRSIKALGFCIKLDTNGSRPYVLERLLDEKLVDYFAMDIKAPLEKYNVLGGIAVKTDLIRRSIDLIKNSGLNHQFRTTVVKALMNEDDISNIANLAQGAEGYVLQNFVPRGELVDPDLVAGPVFSEQEFLLFKKKYEIISSCS